MFVSDDSVIGKKIVSKAVPDAGIGIDTANTLISNIATAAKASAVDVGVIQSFTQVAQDRNSVYDMIDSMCQDSQISAVLESYAEDATEKDKDGRIVWCESDDAKVAEYVTYLLDTMNVDKHIYGWVYSLCKYGDVYLRLYRESDYEDALFDEVQSSPNKKGLNEDVNIRAYSKSDKYVHYLEMVPNPAEVFELTKFGKTSGYIKARVPVTSVYDSTTQSSAFLFKNQYSFNRNDVDVFAATEFVHGMLEGDNIRSPEEVDIFIDSAIQEMRNRNRDLNNLNDDTDTNSYSTSAKLTYSVRRGQSLLYNIFKVWRELQLLEASVLLNRTTQSSLIRVIQVETGDMPDEEVGPTLEHLKALIEQKSAINTGSSLSDYTNPGPIVNNIYVPTHDGKGALSINNLGGDADVKGLADLDYYTNKLYGGLKVPKQYFGFTDDGAGFNGGESLSLISARYGKTIKRVQSSATQMVTDAINLILLDKGLDRYVNKFTIHMLPPATVEDRTRTDNLASEVGMVSDIMNLISDIDDQSIKLRVLKSLLSGVVSDPEIIALIQESIDKIESESESVDVDEDNANIDSTSDYGSGYTPSDIDSEPLDFGGSDNGSTDFSTDTAVDGGESDLDSGSSEATTSDSLPSPSDLGVDFTDNTAEI